jgi:hypothetical protein
MGQQEVICAKKESFSILRSRNQSLKLYAFSHLTPTKSWLWDGCENYSIFYTIKAIGNTNPRVFKDNWVLDE